MKHFAGWYRLTPRRSLSAWPKMVPGLQVATSPLRMCRSVPQIVVLLILIIASLGIWTVGLGRSSRVFCCGPW